MRLDQASVRGPHHPLEFPEFAQETRVPVIDLLRIFWKCIVGICLDVPYAVGQCCASCTSNFLLVIPPFGKFDLVRKQDAVRHHVDEAEFRLDGPQSLLSLFPVRHGLNNLDSEPIVRITREALVSVSRHLELPINISDGRPLIMRVNPSVSDRMVKFDNGTILNVIRCNIVPSIRALHLPMRAKGLSLILHDKDIVLIFMRI